MKKLSFLILYTVFAASAFSQTVQEQNLYTQNPFLINPAFAGSTGGLFSMLGYKSTYTGMGESPRSIYLSLHTPVSGKAALGGNLVSDSRGLLNTFAGNIASSYLINLSSEHKVRFGISGGLFRQSIQLDKVKGNLADPTLYSGNRNFTTYNFGFGAAYFYKDLKVGVALPDLVNESKKLRSYTTVYASYDFKVNDTWKVSPTVMYHQFPVSPNQLDVFVKGTWKNTLWAQLGYRPDNSAIISAGFTWENVALAYAYQANTGIRKDLSKSGHEIALIFTLKKKEKTKELKEAEEDDVVVPKAERKMDTTNYAQKFEEINKTLAAQKRALDSLENVSKHNQEEAQKQAELVKKEMADMEGMKKDLGEYLKNIHDFVDSSHVDISVLEEFDLTHFDYHVAIGTYSDLNFVKFLQKHFMHDYNLNTEIVQSDDHKFYILSAKKVQNKEEALKEMQYLNSRIHEKYFDESARVIKKDKTK